jgi:predicted DNA-binding transcriptional regulator AlpA
LLVSDAVAASLVGLSRSSWWRLHARGMTPAGIKLGRSVRWDRAELERWVQAKCPDRATWRAMTTGSRHRVVG